MKQIDPNVLSISFTDKTLCTRCGTCIGVCPVNALTTDDYFFPKLLPELCIECGLCEAVCPGGSVNFEQLAKLTFDRPVEDLSFDGHVEKTYMGYSGDPSLRNGGAGGGVVTALAWHLLRTGQVDGCIVTRMKPDEPWKGEVFIARTYEDLKQSQQSKYTIIPVNTILQQTRRSKETFALIGLPCQIHGIRMVQQKNPRLVANIRVIIGLFCASSLEPYVAREMLEMKGIDKEDVKNFHFRGGNWPGRIRAVLKNGGIRNLHYSNFKDGAINYLMYLYSPKRCQTCIDGSSEFSDISVSDAWTRDKSGSYVYQSQSRLLARTTVGVETMLSAISTGDLVAQDVTKDSSYQTHRLHARKKGLTAYLRVKRLTKENKAVPSYDRSIDDGTPEEERTERVESLLMKFGRIRAIRLPLFKFLISRYGIPLIKIRQLRKKMKYRQK